MQNGLEICVSKQGKCQCRNLTFYNVLTYILQTGHIKRQTPTEADTYITHGLLMAHAVVTLGNKY